MIAPEAVYIMTNRPRGALYVGRTKNLIWRTWQHRTGAVPGHTRKYKLHRLVWFEWHDGWESAGTREARIKRWRRDWKFTLVERGNPNWTDLWFDIRGDFDEPVHVIADLNPKT